MFKKNLVPLTSFDGQEQVHTCNVVIFLCSGSFDLYFVFEHVVFELIRSCNDCIMKSRGNFYLACNLYIYFV